MTDNLDKVKSRIAKLLAKANNNSNEHEAELAASRARALMDKYQLDEMDISASADANLFGVEIADEVYSYTPKWREWLGTAVAKYNDCQARILHTNHAEPGRPSKKVIMWRGFEEDVALCKQMYTYLADVVDNATSENQRLLGLTRYNARIGTIFKEAMVSRVCDRLAEMLEFRKSAIVSSGTALAIYKENQVAEHFGKVEYKNAGERKWEEATPEEINAYFDGRRAGEEAKIIKSEELEDTTESEEGTE